MDRTAGFQQLIREALCIVAAALPKEDNIRTELNCDDERGHYEILEVGWDGPRRVHGLLVHCDIVDDKIVIEHDGTDFGLADYLTQNGVSADSIVLGFHPPDLRSLTSFAN